MRKFFAWQVVSLMKNEQQSQDLLLKVHPCSTFCNNFLYPPANVSIAWQVDHKVKKTKPWPKSCNGTINVARRVEGFCISYFAAFTNQLFLNVEQTYITVKAELFALQVRNRNCLRWLVCSLWSTVLTDSELPQNSGEQSCRFNFYVLF